MRWIAVAVLILSACTIRRQIEFEMPGQGTKADTTLVGRVDRVEIAVDSVGVAVDSLDSRVDRLEDVKPGEVK